MHHYDFYRNDEDYYQHLGLFFKTKQAPLLENEPQRHYESFFPHAQSTVQSDHFTIDHTIANDM